MNTTNVFYNHSMLDELKIDPHELFCKRVGRRRGNPSGFETPVGHTYSLVLEQIAQESLDATPDVKGFLKFLDDTVLVTVS